MEKYIKILKLTSPFSGIAEEDISSMIKCLQVQLHSFNKGDYVFKEGENVNKINILLEGKLIIQRDDFWGDRNIVNIIRAGEMLCDSYIAPGRCSFSNDIIAEEDSVIMSFDINRVLTTCPSACSFHTQVIQNLFFAVSEKNKKLLQKIRHMSKRTTRTKLLSYLFEEAAQHNSSHFTIPFTRQQLADFLCVDRSAMSNELCKMRDEGLIQFNKNEFTLLCRK